MKKKNLLFYILLCIVFLLLGAGLMYYVLNKTPLITKVINKSEKEVTVNENGISDAVDKLYDAVVIVQSYTKDTLVSSGSGFVYKTIDNKSYILTNNHVVNSADKVSVIFTNGQEIETTVVGKDTYSDIAILSVDKDKIISVATLGSSEASKLGDTVFTIGAPLDSAYSNTVTRGIVSGKDRLVEVSYGNTTTSDYIMKVIQTDAAINSGNSGGPLANSNGEVIGITNMKIASSAVEGMGFAIPIEDAIATAEILEKKGAIERPYLGVTMVDSSDTYTIKRYNINVNSNIEGIIIASVENDSNSDKMGLQANDIIVEVSGVKVKTIAEFRYNLYKHSINDEITLKYYRNSEEKTVSGKLSAK